DSNVNTYSKLLNIHVNTLIYRLKRISQIAEFDLKNVNQKFTIYLYIKLLHMVFLILTNPCFFIFVIKQRILEQNKLNYI
ncbi:helix-turn-helix domain-containing protein, partial [Bacillus subtilis]|uniref:helix-turn-helix domain-containing protein n=1 Tax=Bacillus subtilis TaxID=1423 RepID=UPI0024ACD309